MACTPPPAWAEHAPPFPPPPPLSSLEGVKISEKSSLGWSQTILFWWGVILLVGGGWVGGGGSHNLK